MERCFEGLSKPRILLRDTCRISCRSQECESATAASVLPATATDRPTQGGSLNRSETGLGILEVLRDIGTSEIKPLSYLGVEVEEHQR